MFVDKCVWECLTSMSVDIWGVRSRRPQTGSGFHDGSSRPVTMLGRPSWGGGCKATPSREP